MAQEGLKSCQELSTSQLTAGEELLLRAWIITEDISHLGDTIYLLGGRAYLHRENHFYYYTALIEFSSSIFSPAKETLMKILTSTS